MNRETFGPGPIAPQDISRATEIYKGTRDDLDRELILNTQVVQLNDRGIATRASFEAAMGLIRNEVDPTKPPFMPDAVSDLSGANLVGLANAHFYSEGPRTQTLSSLASRIQGIGARIANVDTSLSPEARRDNPLPEGLLYVFQEMASRLHDQDIDDEARRGLVHALNYRTTPELMEYMLRHQPELVEAMIRSKDEFTNPALRTILDRRDSMSLDAPEDISTDSAGDI